MEEPLVRTTYFIHHLFNFGCPTATMNRQMTQFQEQKGPRGIAIQKQIVPHISYHISAEMIYSGIILVYITNEGVQRPNCVQPNYVR